MRQKKFAMLRQNCSTFMPAAKRNPVMLLTLTKKTTNVLPLGFRLKKPLISRVQLMRSSRTCNSPALWTDWSAATWALVKPKWLCAQPLLRLMRASKLWSWFLPPYLPSNTTKTSVIVLLIRPFGLKYYRVLKPPNSQKAFSKTYPTAKSILLLVPTSYCKTMLSVMT